MADVSRRNGCSRKRWRSPTTRRAVYAAAERFLEGADWVVWQLTGVLARNACAAGYKGTWHKREGHPSSEYLAAVKPGFEDLYVARAAAPIVSSGTAVGTLTKEWSARLGLSPQVVVGAPIIDAHAAVLGGGVAGPGTFVMMMGTSTCHLLMADAERPVEGMAGVVEDGIVPGYFAYESGQAAVGDLFAWFAHHAVPAGVPCGCRRAGRVDPGAAHRAGGRPRAGKQRPSRAGLVAGQSIRRSGDRI